MVPRVSRTVASDIDAPRRVARRQAPDQHSVLDVEGVTEGLVEPDSGFEAELADAFLVEKRGGNRY